VDHIIIYYFMVVGERCVWAEAGSVRTGGQYASENAGISNIYRGENPLRRISKGSWATIVVPGLAGPKSRPQEVCPMENRVDIP
jgi:hypothetical protein